MSKLASGLPLPWRRSRADARRNRPARTARPFRHALAFSFGVSLFLHASLTLPWLAHGWFTPPPPQQHDWLAVDLLGMISNRQVEQQQAGNRAASPAPSPPRPAVARQAPPPRRLQSMPSPVQVERPVEAPTPAPTVPVISAPAAPAADDETRVQQTLQPRETEATLMRKYLVGLRKAIQSRLVYPAEARQGGYTGAPVIRFTITDSGAILPGSLAVHASSGHAVLDDNALRAALAGAPFERPPRQMDVVIAVAFAQEK